MPPSFKIKDKTIIGVLLWLTILESLSIDFYLPAFKSIATDLKLSDGSVQASLSLFLLGFALGQLLWGTLADKMGRKQPLIAGLIIYTISSYLLTRVNSLAGLWTFRFLQAFGGAAGLVIARTIIVDVFNEDKRVKVFSFLSFAMGIAPVVAPALGTFILAYGHWYNLFYMMMLFGCMGLVFTGFFLPETHTVVHNVKSGALSTLKSYKTIIKNRTFLLYTLISSMAYSGLMIYVANAPFMITVKAAYSNTAFSIIFALNAGSLMIAALLVNLLLRYMRTEAIVHKAGLWMFVAGLLGLIAAIFGLDSIYVILFSSVYVFFLGLILPTATAIALSPFEGDTAGKTSALLGFLQLSISGLFSLGTSLFYNGTLLPPTAFLLLCSIIFIIPFSKQQQLYTTNMGR